MKGLVRMVERMVGETYMRIGIGREDAFVYQA